MAQYEDTGWSANTELEKDLAALEADVAGEFGDPELYTGSGEREAAPQGAGDRMVSGPWTSIY